MHLTTLRRLILVSSILALRLTLAWGQSPVLVSGLYERQPLKQVLYQWQADYGVYFSFDPQLLADHWVDTELTHVPLADALKEVLLGSGLTYEIREERFVLITKGSRPPCLCGWLVDSTSGDPIPFATLRLTDNSQGTVSQRDGSFYLGGPFPNGAKLLISHVSYQPQRVNVKVMVTQPCQNVPLTPKPTNIQPITIEEYITDGIRYEGQALHLEPGRLSTLPGLTEPDLFRMIEVLPGVNNPNGTATGLYLRGGTPDQTLVLYNDVPMYETGHYFDMISALNPYAIARANVYRGGYGASKPGRVSGLVDISQGDSIPAQASGGVQANLTHFGGNVELPLSQRKVGVWASFRRSLTEWIPSPTFQGLQQRVFQDTRLNAQLEDDGLDAERDLDRFSDASVKLMWQPHGHKLALSGLWNGNVLDYSFFDAEIDQSTDDEATSFTWGTSLTWRSPLRNHHHQEASLSYSSLRAAYFFGWNALEEELVVESITKLNNVDDARLRMAHHWTPSPQHEWEVGYSLSWQKILYELSYQSLWESQEETDDPAAFTHAAFVQYTGQPVSRLFWQVGMRLIYHDPSERLYAAPRFDMRYRVNQTVNLKAYVGRYHQFVHRLIEWDFDQLELDQQIWVLSDGDDVPVLTSTQVGGGLIAEQGSWLLDIEIYHKQWQDLTSFSPGFGTVPIWDYEQGTGRIQGIDVLVKKRWQHHRAWASYSLSRIDYDFEEFLGESFPAPQDQRHHLKLNYLASLGNWDISLGWTYRSGRPYTPYVGMSTSIAEGEEDEEDYWLTEPIFGQPNSARLPAYHRLDLSIMHQHDHRAFHSSIGFSVINLYNRENVLSRQFLSNYYSEFPTTPEIIPLQRSLLGWLPNVTARISW